MKVKVIGLFLAMFLISACRSDNINFSRALFEHVPEDPEVLVVVRPADILAVVEKVGKGIDFNQVLGIAFEIDTDMVDTYKKMSLEVLKQVGIPWEKVETIGYLHYLDRPALMISGDFKAADVSAKLGEIGFKQGEDGFFEWVYSGFRLSVPADGLIMMADTPLLNDLRDIPTKNRLWNREDFKRYRESSPLDNSIFAWSHPPDNVLSDFPHREDLGDMSMAVNFRGNLSLRTTVRIKDPRKTNALYNLVFGSVSIGKGLLGDDPDYGPLAESITVSHNNKEVVAGLILTEAQLLALINRIKNDINNPDQGSFGKFQSFLNAFQ